MGSLPRTYGIESCPVCGQQHSVDIEVVLRPVDEARKLRHRELVDCVCQKTGKKFRMEIEIDVPENYIFRRARAVSQAE